MALQQNTLAPNSFLEKQANLKKLKASTCKRKHSSMKERKMVRENPEIMLHGNERRISNFKAFPPLWLLLVWDILKPMEEFGKIYASLFAYPN